MNEHEETTSAVSAWIPEARLDEDGSGSATTQVQAQAGPGEQNQDEWRARGSRLVAATRRRVLTTGAVALAIAGGVGIALLANGGGETQDRGALSVNATEVEPETLSDTRVRLNRAVFTRQPLLAVVQRLANLGPSEAAVLAAAAQARDVRGDARANRTEHATAEGSLSLLPVDPDTRYVYLRRVGATAVVLGQLGDRARSLGGSETIAQASSGLRARADRLAVIVSGLDIDPYLRSRRLSSLVALTVKRVDRLIELDRAPELRRLTRGLALIGDDLIADLESGAAAASARKPQRARRFLARLDRRLGDLVFPVPSQVETGRTSDSV